MSCPHHPKWYHDREDCPYCAEEKQKKLRTWEEIEAEDLTLCNDVCRELRARVYEMRMYLIGNAPLTNDMKKFWWADPMEGLEDANPKTDV